jgi:Homeobox KN domain
LQTVGVGFRSKPFVSFFQTNLHHHHYIESTTASMEGHCHESVSDYSGKSTIAETVENYIHCEDGDVNTPLALKLRSKHGNASISRNAAKKPTTLPNEAVEYLKAWMMSPEHIAHPYPTETEKVKIMHDTGLELKQLTNWFVNNRKRYWKPRVEAHILNEKELQVASKASYKSLAAENGENANATRVLQELGCTSTGRLLMSEQGSDSLSAIRSTRRISRKEKSKLISDTLTPTSFLKSPKSHLVSRKTHLISGNTTEASQSDGTASSDSDDDRCAYSAATQPQKLQSKFNEPVSRTLHAINTSLLGQGLSDDETSPNRLDYSGFGSLLNKDAESTRVIDPTPSTTLKNAFEVALSNSLATAVNDNIAQKRKREVHIIPHRTSCDISEIVIELCTVSPRPKYRRQSIDAWKEACQTANHVYDDDLPSLEEATRLFGYTC